MKATLQVLTVLFGAFGVMAALAGLFGVHSSVAFLTSETAICFYAVAGLMLIGFVDYSRRPAIATVRAPAAREVRPVRRSNAYGIRRRNHVTF